MLNTQTMLADDCQSQSNRIDIWEFPLDCLSPLASSLLNESELMRANRYYFERHKRRFTLARAMLRLILGRYLHQDAKQLIFHYNDHGKPQLNSAEQLEFNLSHSKDLALLAVGQQFSLGIDLEFFSARPYDGIANTLFSLQELKLFLPLPTYLKPQIFFHIWAQKEAFIKACGLGLSYPTQQFTVPVFPETPVQVKDSVHNKEWFLSSFMPKIGCSAALCCHPTIQHIRYIRLNSADELFIKK